MSEIKTFAFEKSDFAKIKEYRFGQNWPAVYIIEDGKEIYIGETTSIHSRCQQHYDKPNRKKLEKIHIITDDEFNKSAALDIESRLIQFMIADQKFVLQNGNSGLRGHNYFDKEKYEAKFEIAWENLREKGLVINSLSDLFKYSPYKSLNEDQFFVAGKIYKDIKDNVSNAYIINGKPGTGKTILATYLFKYLKEKDETKHLNIGLVVPMSSLRQTIKKVFSKIKHGYRTKRCCTAKI
ncbi:MAG: hypothetical protein JWP09_542 [Candidatus Taylorbacteria bacterium]|nr:hypothetical protein [Candidatus Taylorbacteria bacterium]